MGGNNYEHRKSKRTANKRREKSTADFLSGTAAVSTAAVSTVTVSATAVSATAISTTTVSAATISTTDVPAAGAAYRGFRKCLPTMWNDYAGKVSGMANCCINPAFPDRIVVALRW